jgi:hypothetical protein
MRYIRIVEAVWNHLADSEEDAQTGEVTITLSRKQAHELNSLYWACAGKYRKALKNFGWSPIPEHDAARRVQPQPEKP